MKVGKGMFRAMRGTVRAAAWFDSMNWYAVQTKPRLEAIVQTSLAREGVETFLPKLRQRRRDSGRAAARITGRVRARDGRQRARGDSATDDCCRGAGRGQPGTVGENLMMAATTTVISAERHERFRQFVKDLWDYREL